MILGMQWLKQHNPIVDWREHKLTLAIAGRQFEISGSTPRRRLEIGPTGLGELLIVA